MYKSIHCSPNILSSLVKLISFINYVLTVHVVFINLKLTKKYHQCLTKTNKIKEALIN